MLSVVRKRHAYPNVLRDMIVLAREFEADEALAGGLIDGIWTEEEAVEKVEQKAEDMSDLGSNKANMAKIKGELHKDVAYNCLSLQIAPNNVSYKTFPVFPKL